MKMIGLFLLLLYLITSGANTMFTTTPYSDMTTLEKLNVCVFIICFIYGWCLVLGYFLFGIS